VGKQAFAVASQQAGLSAPAGNTGAEITEAPAPGTVRCCLDWLEGFLPAELRLDDVLDMFRLPADASGPDQRVVQFDQRESARGVRYYQSSHVRISERASGGWFVCVSGRGCRELELAGVVDDWVSYCDFLLTYSFRATRLDFAIDDGAGLVPLGAFRQMISRFDEDRSPMRTRAQQCRVIEKFERGGGPGGVTYYIGAASSDTLVRIYDKAAQRGLDSAVTPWTRVELQLRAERAHEAMRMLTSTGDVRCLVGVLRSHVDFLDPDDHQANVSRRAIAPWWAALTQGVERSRLLISKAQRSLNDVVSWLHRQVAPSLGLLSRIPEWGLDMILSLAVDGQERLSRRHQRILREAMAQKGEQPYALADSGIYRNRLEITELVDSYRWDIVRSPI